MDINYLLQREQIERVRAGLAASDPSRDAHAEMADGYRRLIEGHRARVVAAFASSALRPLGC